MLAEDPELGLVGTPFKGSSSPTYDYRFVSIEHVSGACQLFRRECFEEIGGYVPVKGGGVDSYCGHRCKDEGVEDKDVYEQVCLHASGNRDGRARNLDW